jgi:hypothetical protein
MTSPRPAAFSLTGAATILTLAGLLAVLVPLVWRFAPELAAWARGDLAVPSQATRIARRSIVYRLDAQRATTFRFTQPVSLARLVFQPELARRALGPGVQRAYAIKVELLDRSGAVMDRHEIWSSAMPFGANGQRRGAFRFYREKGQAPGEIGPDDEVRIASRLPFAAIRVRAGPADPGVLAVDMRLYEQLPLLEQEAEFAFFRLSPADQQTLSESSAFPPAMLTREERIALARNQWRPVGPTGIEGRDYAMKVLYESQPDPASKGEAQQ